MAKIKQMSDCRRTVSERLIYYFGTDIVHQIIKSFCLLSKSRFAGHRFAQYQLGLMYREGRGTTKDEKKDSDWFMKEAENQQSCPRGNIYVA